MADYYVSQHVLDDPSLKSAHDFGLTGRELEILHMIVESNTSQDIANSLYISLRTVETHRSNIMQKLGLKNSAALVRFAIENGIITPPRQVV
jgi:DNA-binding CsgD family transcriptional regulator